MKSLAVTIFALSTLSAVSAPTVAQTPLGPPVTWSVAAGGNVVQLELTAGVRLAAR